MLGLQDSSANFFIKGNDCLISPDSKVSLSSKRPGVSRMKRHRIKLLHQETDEHLQGCL